jgi:UDP-N-acetylglucosamine acyltransferase
MIHPTAIIDPGVELVGDGIVIQPYAVISAPCRIIGPCYIGAHAVIGAPPQHHGSYPSPMTADRRVCGVIIEANTTIREFVTVHQGCLGQTIICEGATIMAGCHVAHDCVVGERSTLATFSVLGGFTMIADDVTFGQGVITHPWAMIGEGAMIGLNSSVIKDVLPYSKVAGSPARLLGSNTHRDPQLPPEYAAECISVRVWEDWANMGNIRKRNREEWANA